MNNKFWLYFIILQPFIDVATNFMVRSAEWPITLGIIIRMGILVLAFFVTAHYLHTNHQRKLLLVNLAICAYLGINLIVNWIFKEPFNLMYELEFLAKTAYPFQLFFVFYILFTTMKTKREELVKFLTVNLVAISLFVIVPSELGVAFESYGASYEGSTGWFNSANEVGAAIAFLLPLVIWGIYKEYLKWLGVGAVVLASYSAYLIGTKVSLGSVLVILISSVLFIAYKNRLRFDRTMVAVLIPMIFLFAGFNQSPAMNNVEAVEENLEQREINYEVKEEVYTPDQVVEVTEIQRLKEKSHPKITQFLSSRDIYVLQHAGFFQEANVMRQLFGMGYATEYVKKPKVTEMDFFDFFFSFGIIGSGLLIALLVKPMIRVVKAMWHKLRAGRFGDFDYFLIFATSLLLGISFIAGHVIFTPSVSLYLAMAIALLFSTKDLEKKNSL